MRRRVVFAALLAIAAGTARADGGVTDVLALTGAGGNVDFGVIRVRYEKELLENVVPFWEKHSVDTEFGGFLTCLGRDGRPYDTFKQMWMQWREVWMFAALYNSEYRQARWLKIAEAGYDFLYAHGRQPDGSYAYMLDRKGNVTSLAGDGGSEIFNESFAAVACAELYLATKNERYRAEALNAYASYRRRTSAAEKRYAQLAYPMIALNVVCVMNRAFGGFDDEIDRCIKAIRTFDDPKTGLIHERRFLDGTFDHDTQDGRFVNPGHTLEGLSFIFARLREKPDAELAKFALEKAWTMGSFGWDDEQGGVRYFRDERDAPIMRNDAPLKAWWPQAEAMTTMLRAYELSGERRYLDYFLRTDAYATANLRDAKEGEWFAYKAVDGRQFHSYKGSRYKGFFHVPRYLLDCIRVLKRLESRASSAAETPTAPAAAKCRVPERFRNHPLFTTRHCSVNFGFLARYGYFADPQVFAQCAKIKEAGANWVTLNTHFCQETFYSTRLFLDFDWSSGEAELEAIVDELHRQGLHVLLKPCLTSLDSAWMGEVHFPGDGQEQISGVRTKYWHDWFESFRRCLTYYCRFAERTGCEAMIVGAEYHGTIGQNDEWLKTLEHVRKHYSGPITYEVMPYEIVNGVFNTWMGKLDFLGVSTYPSASPKGPARDDRKLWPKSERVPLEEMKKVLVEECKPLKAALDKYFPGMPIIFTEIGTRSARGVVNQPWDYLTDSLWDGQEQADYMEAVYQTFSDDPRWLGLSWWKWDETQKTRSHYDPDPKKDRGFSIYGKPAAEVMRKWSKQTL